MILTCLIHDKNYPFITIYERTLQVIEKFFFVRKNAVSYNPRPPLYYFTSPAKHGIQSSQRK